MKILYTQAQTVISNNETEADEEEEDELRAASHTTCIIKFYSIIQKCDVVKVTSGLKSGDVVTLMKQWPRFWRVQILMKLLF